MSKINTIAIGVEDSSTIKDALYLPNVESLMVRFQTDKIYSYYRVPMTTFIDLISFTEGFSQAFNKLIKGSKFEYNKIDDVEMIEAYMGIV